ncbi:hypothetical protein DL98DRAFT_564842 [Cadophora sp. DSE1049]|nr:hypothetical protein DL98DRAFT_564842 [Cadophora sp. DSE1049]
MPIAIPSSKSKRTSFPPSLLTPISLSHKPNPTNTFLPPDVLSALSTTRPLFTSYLRVRSLPNPPGTPSPELLSAQADLKSVLSSLAEDLADLVESVKVVQSDSYKYRLEIEEVSRRKRLVDEVGGEVEDIREEIAKTGSGSSAGYVGGNEGRGEDEIDYNAKFEQQQQLHMIAKQDRDLDGVFRAVRNLKRMGEVVKAHKNRLSSCCIGMLIFVLILLLVLVLIL